MWFAKEASVATSELFSDIDTLDVQARQETLKMRAEPQLLQLPLVPAYALTIHKTQVIERGLGLIWFRPGPFSPKTSLSQRANSRVPVFC